jgi:hypothetical protein
MFRRDDFVRREPKSSRTPVSSGIAVQGKTFSGTGFDAPAWYGQFASIAVGTKARNTSFTGRETLCLYLVRNRPFDPVFTSRTRDFHTRPTRIWIRTSLPPCGMSVELAKTRPVNVTARPLRIDLADRRRVTFAFVPIVTVARTGNNFAVPGKRT